MKKALLLACIISTAGCTNPILFPLLIDPDDAKDPIELAKKYRESREMGSLLFLAPERPLEQIEEREGYAVFDQHWCNPFGDQYDLRAKLNMMCMKQYEGTYDEADHWCKSKNDEPLFLMFTNKERRADNCSLLVAAVAMNRTLSKEKWKTVAENRLGFKSLEQKERDRIAMQAEATRLMQQGRQAIEKKKEENALLLSSGGIGTRICKKSKYYDANYIGFVEDNANGKVKINVVDLGGNGWSVGGFKPHEIWDYPNNWNIC